MAAHDLPGDPLKASPPAGLAFLMPAGKPHSAELKAAAIAAVDAGEQPAAVARRFGISQGRLKEWCDIASGRLHARTREELAELVYDAVAETLKSLTARARVTGRPDWIEKQSAADLAAMAATDWDRILRMVAGFRPVDDPAQLPATTDRD